MDYDLWRAVLPDDILPQEGPCEHEPVDYGEGFVLPVHSVKPLQLLHTHPLDASLKFYEGPHVYTVDGCRRRRA